MDIIIYGISGNLAERKLIPAIRNLHAKGKIPDDSRVIGFSRSHKQFDLPFPYEHIGGHYTSIKEFAQLKGMLQPGKKSLFYLALPPDASRHVVETMHKVGLSPDRVLIEKPFGIGYEDAKSFADFINVNFSKGQCLKVDHYAGKPELREFTKENIADIAEVTCEIFETATVEHRKGFYDNVGALRDVGQNHLLFMLATALKGSGSREHVIEKLVFDPSRSLFARYAGSEGKETFFSIKATYEHIRVTLSAGKGLSENRAAIRMIYKDGKEKEIVLAPGTIAYENVLMGAINSEAKSFLSDREVLAAWKFIEAAEELKEKKEILCYPIGYDQRFFNAEDA